jgi:hypothetical protein
LALRIRQALGVNAVQDAPAREAETTETLRRRRDAFLAAGARRPQGREIVSILENRRQRNNFRQEIRLDIAVSHFEADETSILFLRHDYLYIVYRLTCTNSRRRRQASSGCEYFG